MGEQNSSSKIGWKLNLAELIMQVDQLPEVACRDLLKMMYSRMHEGAAAENFQQINVDEAIAQLGGDAREAFKRYFKGWFLLNIPLEGGSLGPAPTDAPPIVQRVWKNLEKLLLHPLEDEVLIAGEVQKRTNVFEAAAREYSIRLAGAAKALEMIPEGRKKLMAELQDAYTNVERAAKDIQDLSARYAQSEKRIETQERQIAGIRAETERLIKARDEKLKEAQADIEGKKSLLGDLTAELESARTTNEALATRVGSLEGALAKERTDKETYQQQSGRVQKAYDDKEKELVQEREITKSERGKADAAKEKADKLEKKLNNINIKWGVKVGIGAALLAAGLFFYRPSGQVAPVENVPQEVINYSKDRITVKFGSTMYEMSADRFSEIYQNIQKDQQKSARQFTPADRKQYFEKKAESTRQIK